MDEKPATTLWESIQELEAENLRLREALQLINLGGILGMFGQYREYSREELMDVAGKALE